jgi:hypothetical protein
VAELARAVWADGALADRLDRDAAELRTRFHRDFWVDTPAGGVPALGRLWTVTARAGAVTVTPSAG